MKKLSSIIAIALLALSAHAASPSSEFLDLCEKDWDSFEKNLPKTRETWKREIGALSQKDYDARYEGDDEQIRLISLFWPSDLSEKDPTWKFFKDCADRNFEARKALDSGATDAQQKKAAVKSLRNCLVAAYSPKQGVVPAPFDRLLACYEKRATK